MRGLRGRGKLTPPREAAGPTPAVPPRGRAAAIPAVFGPVAARSLRYFRRLAANGSQFGKKYKARSPMTPLDALTQLSQPAQGHVADPRFFLDGTIDASPDDGDWWLDLGAVDLPGGLAV